jgi:SAM-dependent methyltransferase
LVSGKPSSRVFQIVSPEPPLPYADGMFDVVFACSVMTHLTEDRQGRWLSEVKRILTVGGVFLASTHGAHARRFLPTTPTTGWLNSVRRRLGLAPRSMRLRGIEDLGEDTMLEGIAPPGYYRSTFQSKDYTFEKWSRHFEILAYTELGLSGHQDLILMKRVPAK